MRRVLLALLIVMVAMGAIVAEGQKEASGKAAPVTLKFAHVYETSEAFHEYALWAAEEIANRTDGRYKIEVFPASSLGKESDIVEGLSLGTVDIVYAGGGFLAGTYGPLGLTEAAFVFKNFDHWKNFADSDFFNELADGYADASGGHKALAVTYYGARCVTSNKPINTPADMKNLKIRVPNAPIYLLFTEAVGANAAPIAFAEVYLALQQGVVDAQENPLPTIKAKKFYEVQDYINMTKHMTNNLFTIVSSMTWNKLSAADKEIFDDVLKEAAAKASNAIDQAEKDLIPWFEKQGVTVNQNVDREAFIKTVAPHLTSGDKMTWTVEQYNKMQALAD
ncbi:sialic acid TRAP transporter substrate-binding protein SiaP [Marispirochaeta sp.]|jgi:tripartite ATP-independent transporter DctP family solute receptor|uniref:sialic acid TRAP transporter substrate-binding protein SiaP n=1 Tax=Marispirochaeta sp. TaxID=2038653 RepID=UPI0029C60125|nr:sialic acid TRAP transporter substrate-binding protein SiaP [Marispirochaeta sp.]